MLYTTEQQQEFKNHTFAHLLIEEKEHLLTLTLNRPEKKNALNPVLFKELAYALTCARNNRNIWAVVIAAKGDVFCAGADLKAFSGQTEETTSTIPEPNGEVVIGDVFNSLHKPCIAKVHAPVYAGGFLIICGCTHVIATSNATFSLPEVKRGLFPFQVMQSMLQIMPPRAVLDFCIRAKTASALDAEKIGLVNKVVEPAQLDADVQALADEIFQYSPSAIRLGLEAFDDLKRIPASEAHNHMKQMLGECIQTEDAAEGMKAFIEKSPSPSLDEELRTRMGEAAVALAKAVKYTNAGTVEFLLDEQKNFYFLEVNTRLQVEHPVTEMVVGVDLVQMQIGAAMGIEVNFPEEMLMQRGHSIECRICAEDPENNFFPSTGRILYTETPFSFSTRIDSGIETESEVNMFYDSMLAKLIVVGDNRASAIQKMEVALDNFPILGITTNKDFLKELLQHPQFIDGTFDTKLIERDFSSYKKLVSETELHETAIAAMLLDWVMRKEVEKLSHSLNGWRNIFYQPQSFEVEFSTGKVRLAYRYKQNRKFEVNTEKEKYAVEIVSADGNTLILEIGNHRSRFFVASNQTEYFIQHPSAGTFRLKQVPRFTEPGTENEKGGYIAPMPGEIVKVLVKAGDKVQSGKGLLVMSSMKMETTIEAHSDGEVEEVFVAEKNFVEASTVLLKMKE